MDTLITPPILLEDNKNKSSPSPPIDQQLDNDIARRSFYGIISTGSPICTFTTKCQNRSVPGSNYCGPHGGKLTLRDDNTIGIIGPGTYRAIASLAGLNHRYVSQVLQGKSNPTQRVLDKIAQVVGVDVGWLLRYIDEKKTEND